MIPFSGRKKNAKINFYIVDMSQQEKLSFQNYINNNSVPRFTS